MPPGQSGKTLGTSLKSMAAEDEGGEDQVGAAGASQEAAGMAT